MEDYNNWGPPPSTKLKAEWWHWWYNDGEPEDQPDMGGPIPGKDVSMGHKSQSSNPNTYKAQYMPNQTRIQEAFQKGYHDALNEQSVGPQSAVGDSSHNAYNKGGPVQPPLHDWTLPGNLPPGGKFYRDANGVLYYKVWNQMCDGGIGCYEYYDSGGQIA